MKNICQLVFTCIISLLSVINVLYAQQAFTNFQEANIVIGQPDFTSQLTSKTLSTTPGANSVAINKNGVFAVGSQRGGVWIGNSVPAISGQAADLILNVGGNDGVAFSPDGSKLLVSESSAGRVLIWNTIPTSGDQAADVVISSLNYPSGIKVTNDGRVIFAETYGHVVRIFNSVPTTNVIGTDADVVLSDLRGPYAVETTSDEKLLIAEYSGHRILIYNSIPTTNTATPDIILGSGIARTTASDFYHPMGVRVSPTGQLAIGEFGNRRVLIYNQIPTVSGTSADIVLGQPDFITSASFNGGVSAKSMTGAYHVFYDKYGRLFVPGRDMHRVMVFGEELESQSIGDCKWNCVKVKNIINLALTQQVCPRRNLITSAFNRKPSKACMKASL